MQRQNQLQAMPAKPVRPGLSWATGGIAAALLVLAGCAGDDTAFGGVAVGPSAIEGLQPSGRIEMNEVQAAYIGSGSGGTGTLWYRGRAHPFTVGGAGIGGLGVSSIEATGEVYKLDDLSQFPGAYAQGRYGGEADRADAQPGRGCRCHLDESVTNPATMLRARRLTT